jgi:hypothetical protein
LKIDVKFFARLLRKELKGGFDVADDGFGGVVPGEEGLVAGAGGGGHTQVGGWGGDEGGDAVGVGGGWGFGRKEQAGGFYLCCGGYVFCGCESWIVDEGGKGVDVS